MLSSESDMKHTAPSIPPASPHPPVLVTLSQRARLLRQRQGLTLRALASRSGLSLRFLLDVEAGRGNISVRRLADLATLTRNTVRFGRAAATELLATPTPLQQRALDLLGLKPAL